MPQSALLLNGRELFEYIVRRNYLPEPEAVKFFAQIVVGVSYLHSVGIVHRDLKLENILLDSNQNIVIADFGFASQTVRNNSELLETSCGSPAYAAPELVLKDSYSGVAADIWSCGVILYSMLAGYLPFDDDPSNPDGANIHLLYQYIMSAKPQYPDYLSADAKDLIGMMLVTDPDKRAGLADVMGHSWLAPAVEIFEEELVRRKQLMGISEEEETVDVLFDAPPQNDSLDIQFAMDGSVPSVNASSDNTLPQPNNEVEPQSMTQPTFFPFHSRISSENLAGEADQFEHLLDETHEPMRSASAEVPVAPISNGLVPIPRASFPQLASDARFVSFSTDTPDNASKQSEKNGKQTNGFTTMFRQGTNHTTASSVNDASLAASDYNSRHEKGSRKLKLHSNRALIDKRALSSRDVDELFDDLESVFSRRFGMDLDNDGVKSGEYKLKFTQPGMITTPGSVEGHEKVGGDLASSRGGVVVDLQALARSSPELVKICKSLEESIKNAEKVRLDSSTAKALSKAVKSRAHGVGGIFPWITKRLQYVSNYGLNYNKGFSRTNIVLPGPVSVKRNSVYAPSPDFYVEENGSFESSTGVVRFFDEVTFEVEIFKVKNMPDTNVVEFKRIRGDIWEFKSIYNRLISELPLDNEY
ncbi:hypothetical protein HK100_009463 [Physocladia obscura]|uniref:non-specific serine/threonine protein kinase n=1 Tax=Physocladia obscura TaxID=109957 RepID=A0AAD5T382_9FUNG|nr:hypothetical protein HK100_009463 [Physocladia obscura]